MPTVFPFVPTWTDQGTTEDVERSIMTHDVFSNSFRIESLVQSAKNAVPIHLELDAPNETADLIEWFRDIAKGRGRNFWLPSYQRDITLAANAAAGFSSITIKNIGFTVNHFLYPARRHLAFIANNGTITHRYVTNSVDNGDGTETLTLDGNVPVTFKVNGALISFMLLVRLQSDSMKLSFISAFEAECDLVAVELPNEVTAAL